MKTISASSDFPKIRYVEAFPVETEVGRMIGLRDPSGIASDTLLLSPDVFYLLQYFDGKHSTKDLRYEYTHAFGQFLYEENLLEIITNLDKNLFLDNHNFREELRRIENEFLSQPVRPAAHAGLSYEADPTNLKAQIRSFFEHENGAGLPNSKVHDETMKGMIVPHIDLRAGGPCYSHAYKALAESADPDCFIIIGTGHSGLMNLYSALPKDFATPMGQVACDFEFLNLLEKNYTGDFLSEALSQKTEHTIEFQLLFLQYLYQNRKPFTIVPILASFSYHFLDGQQFAREAEIVREFSQALQTTISQFGKKVCVIASVDFSHIGRRYGDENAPDGAFMASVNEVDQQLLRHAASLDAQGFYQCVKKNEDRYRVCGFAPIYTMLNAIEARSGNLLEYTDTVVDSENSRVTFASMVFF